MMLQRIYFKNFKRLKDTEIPLGRITVLVGANNSGKSCVLQGAHFGASLMQTTLRETETTFSPDKLRYLPTADVFELAHGERLTGDAEIIFGYSFCRDGVEETDDFEVFLRREKEGLAIAAGYNGIESQFNQVSNLDEPFTIYVPGLSGIPHSEEYRSKAVVDNGIARGDANLFLRNVLLQIHRNKNSRRLFHDLLHNIFPKTKMYIEYEEENHLYIDVRLEQGGFRLPLDMAGTGVLHSLQLIAYVVNYKPALILLDEPDAHLHPNNQRLIAGTLSRITEQIETQILLATHSRTMLDAFSGDTAFRAVWMKEGVAQAEKNVSKVAILMQLGALEVGERLAQGSYKFVILSEDTNFKYLRVLLEASGFDLNDVHIQSYKSSSKIEGAMMFAELLRDLSPATRLVIHRDRDLMLEDEVTMLCKKYQDILKENIDLFITDGPDIEHYFINEDHLSETLSISKAEIAGILKDLCKDNLVHLVVEYREKRENIKYTLYKNDKDSCPSTEKLLQPDVIALEQICGKTILKKLGPILQEKYGKNLRDIIVITQALEASQLKALSHANASQS